MSAADRIPLLRLLQLASPALPVGAYAYSEALEYAVFAGWVADEPAAQAWILGRLDGTMGTVDAPLLAHMHAAFAAGRGEDAVRLSEMLLCLRESAELRHADRDMGTALARLLCALADDPADDPAMAPHPATARHWLDAAHTTYAAVFALAAAGWGIDAEHTVMGYLFAWAENQAAAAIKLVPLGHSAGQRVLMAAGSRIPAVAGRALAMSEDRIAGSAPGLAIAAARHEAMYARLYRS